MDPSTQYAADVERIRRLRRAYQQMGAYTARAYRSGAFPYARHRQRMADARRRIQEARATAAPYMRSIAAARRFVANIRRSRARRVASIPQMYNLRRMYNPGGRYGPGF